MTDRPLIRRQLSLFVPPAAAEPLQALRRVLDPVQSALIPAHVTLCREDELALLAETHVRTQLAGGTCQPFTLHFGRAQAFSGHGIMLRCISGEDQFHALRAHVLGAHLRQQLEPHLTLAHPRNPKAPGNTLQHALQLPADLAITFDRVCLIEQHGSNPWQVIATFDLAA